MNQIERIQMMEELYDEAKQTMEEVEQAIRKYYAIQDKILILEAYYRDEWQQDYEDDEQGKLPKNMKRGVLSQDGLDDVLFKNERFYKEYFR